LLIIKEVALKDKYSLVRQSRFFCFVLALSMLFLHVSCSSTPSESLAVDYIGSIGSKDKLFKVKSLKKTNGLSEGNQYTMEYEFEIECLKSNTDNEFFIPQAVGQIPCKRAGEVQKGKGWLSFEKPENGWQVDKILGSGTWRSPRGSLEMNPY
jgi:hypothetical protein